MKPFQARVNFGLNRGYSEELIPKEDILRDIQIYQSKLLSQKNIHLSVSISDSLVVLLKQREPHLVLNFINYPRFPLEEPVIKSEIENIIQYLMSVFDQNRVVIEYRDETVMLEYSEEVDPKANTPFPDGLCG